MNKRLYALLVSVAILIGIQFSAVAQTNTNDDSSDYLKIFTPYHTVKSVFVDVYPELNALQCEIYFGFEKQLSEEDKELIARIVYAESKGEPYIGKIGVASVILNRLNHPCFPKSIKNIVYQKNAFSCISNNYESIKPDIETYKAVYEALNGYDPTDNCVFFYNPDTSSSKWIKTVPKENITIIGRHVFFK